MNPNKEIIAEIRRRNGFINPHDFDYAARLVRLASDYKALEKELKEIDIFLYQKVLDYTPDRLLTLRAIKKLHADERDRLKEELAATKAERDYQIEKRGK
jgi:hypothetical protein